MEFVINQQRRVGSRRLWHLAALVPRISGPVSVGVTDAESQTRGISSAALALPPLDRMVERSEVGDRLVVALTGGPAVVALTTGLRGVGGEARPGRRPRYAIGTRSISDFQAVRCG